MLHHEALHDVVWWERWLVPVVYFCPLREMLILWSHIMYHFVTCVLIVPFCCSCCVPLSLPLPWHNRPLGHVSVCLYAISVAIKSKEIENYVYNQQTRLTDIVGTPCLFTMTPPPLYLPSFLYPFPWTTSSPLPPCTHVCNKSLKTPASRTWKRYIIWRMYAAWTRIISWALLWSFTSMQTLSSITRCSRSVMTRRTLWIRCSSRWGI